MAEQSDGRVIVATQFSRLREGDDRGPGAEVPDLRVEAMTALSEAMDLLSGALQSSARGEAWEDARRARLEERVRELTRRVEDGPKS